MGDESKIRRTRRTAALAACVALPLLFGAIAYAASRTKSATMDEPLHAVGAWLHVFHGDYRINPEDPPLWNYWAMLPHGRSSLTFSFDDPEWSRTLRLIDLQTRITTRTLYQTTSNDGAAFVQRSRAMMALVGVGLGWLIAIFARKLAGPVAAVVAVTLYSFDPNFIAYAPLVKNDVAITLIFLALAMMLWSVGRRLTWWNMILLGLLCGAAAATKYSGLLAAPLVVAVLVIRALLGRPWIIFRHNVHRRVMKLATAASACTLCAILGLGVIWASYGFRYAPTDTPDARLDTPFQVKAAMQNRFFQEHGRFATDDELASQRPQVIVRLAEFADRARLLPHAYVYGFLFTYQTSLVRMAYLMGELNPTGWWYYFPLAMLFKTPLATLAAALVAVELAVVTLVKRRSPTADPWILVCLLGLPIIYALSAMTTSLNLGLRHVLPLYPFIFILIGLAASAMWAQWRRAAGAIAAVLGVGLIVETIAAVPDYIPFFNALAKPHRLHLLSDSNLDWGQDLPLVARWQRENPHERLYLCYFGSADPAFYGIEYVNLPPGFWLGPPYQWPTSPGVIAISATYLQENHTPANLRGYYRPLRRQTPRAILGGSIYLYDYGPPQTENRP